MKNLMTFVSPKKDFNEECKVLAKIQIDNSLDLGWKKEDIILVTNFPYEYNGVKSFIVSDDVFYAPLPPTTKLYAIIKLLDERLIGNNLCWYHDFDAYQFNPITEEELGLGSYDIGITNYSRAPRWCSASMFFKRGSKDIFVWIKDMVEKYKSNEEIAFQWWCHHHPQTVGSRVKHINITYAFHIFNIRSCIRIANMPIRAAHFHPTPDKLDFYMYGKNKIDVVLMPERLTKIFHKHGLK